MDAGGYASWQVGTGNEECRTMIIESWNGAPPGGKRGGPSVSLAESIFENEDDLLAAVPVG
jgi:hypothetical protein